MNDDPPPRLRPDEILGHADLSLREAVLSSAGGHRWVRQAGVVFGRPVLYRNTVEDFPPTFRARPDAGRWGYATVVFPFDLEELPRERDYVTATVRVVLDGADVVALNLQPAGLVGADGLAGALQLPWATVARPDGGWPRRPRTSLRITVAGFGQGRFWWRLADADGGMLDSGGHVVRAVLQFQPERTELLGAQTASAVLMRPELGGAERVELETPSPQRFALALTETSPATGWVPGSPAPARPAASDPEVAR